jgi:hypothetical protein
MKNMANSIRDRDQSLTQAIEQETAMAREIHHRVKNNLQIVSSLIGLYSQRITDPQSQVAFRQIAVRVDALALVHRLMEKNDTVPVVDTAALFTEMADQMRNTATENGKLYRLGVKVEEHLLRAATVTPIALFAAEVMSFGLFKPGERHLPRDVRLSFAADGPSHLLLSIEDNSFSADDLRVGIPSPQRFLGAFADQLQGHYWLESLQPEGCKIFLRIPASIATAGADFDDCTDKPAVFRFRSDGKSVRNQAEADADPDERATGV